MVTLQSVHPFPARMAPEIALAACRELPAGALVLDPMAGSGTVLRAASDQGLRASGYDLDPLAVLMARVATTPIVAAALPAEARTLVAIAAAMRCGAVSLPAIDTDAETLAFVEKWFAPVQCCALRRLSAVLQAREGAVADALRIALSRTIVTKCSGASLAQDVSHSRPHRVRGDNDYDVLAGFVHAADRLAQYLELHPPAGRVSVAVGDARRLDDVPAVSVDAVITSPPYLNAIDYLRGHRFALVWLGYTVRQTRAARAVSIGTERAVRHSPETADLWDRAAALYPIEQLPGRLPGIVVRYVADLQQMLGEVARILRPGRKAVLVAGNSSLRGVFHDNAQAICSLAEQVGLAVMDVRRRALPPNRRYLPPPADAGRSALEKRMREEVVLTLVRTA